MNDVARLNNSCYINITNDNTTTKAHFMMSVKENKNFWGNFDELISITISNQHIVRSNQLSG